MKQCYFVISLDFELFWGIHDAFDINSYYDNVNNVNEVIPKLLDLFKKHNIHATFATVGAIYHQSYEDFIVYSADAIPPKYKKLGLSPYEEVNLAKEKDYPELHFAPYLISKIRDAGQEIGTHTYSHYYCTEAGAELDTFESDIKKAIGIAKRNGDNVKSIIFPRNQIGTEDFLSLIKKYGIIAYRGNPYDAFAGKSPLRRMYRFLSSYFPISSEVAHVGYEQDVINIPASHFLRPYTNVRVLNRLQLNRIKRSMKETAKDGGIYHLWWHPHNMGGDVENNLNFLELILEYYDVLHKEYGMVSASMAEVAESYRKKNP